MRTTSKTSRQVPSVFSFCVGVCLATMAGVSNVSASQASHKTQGVILRLVQPAILPHKKSRSFSVTFEFHVINGGAKPILICLNWGCLSVRSLRKGKWVVGSAPGVDEAAFPLSRLQDWVVLQPGQRRTIRVPRMVNGDLRGRIPVRAELWPGVDYDYDSKATAKAVHSMANRMLGLRGPVFSPTVWMDFG